MQVLFEHDQPVPDNDTSVSPGATVSVTVTVPLVGAAFAAFVTVIVYVAFCCPMAKLPVWKVAMLSVGPSRMIVESVAVALAEPPPETDAMFTWGELAFWLTDAVTVMVG